MLWLCTAAPDDECIHGEMLNTALGLGPAAALLCVRMSPMRFLSGGELIFLFLCDSIRGTDLVCLSL